MRTKKEVITLYKKNEKKINTINEEKQPKEAVMLKSQQNILAKILTWPIPYKKEMIILNRL